MSSFLLALQFLTIIPLRIKDVNEDKIAKAAAYFPLTGLLIGLFLLGINALLSALNFPSLAISIILIVSLIAVTGGMHLDGLSDTADAFLSNKPKDEMLAIMRDPHIGVMGALSIVSVILLKIGLFYSVDTSLKAPALLLMCVLSRWGAVEAMFWFPYARKDGKAGVFIKGMNKKIFIIGLILACVFSLLIWQFQGLFALFIASGCAYAGGWFANRRIRGITGDTLGATIELTELVTLFIFCIAGGLFYG